ncbi:hypothetical protein TNCV_4770451 [Trichonephila clavipes]|nr:hypothetical protein TNCV_4770451 [Trichonephila clavipes]
MVRAISVEHRTRVVVSPCGEADPTNLWRIKIFKRTRCDSEENLHQMGQQAPEEGECRNKASRARCVGNRDPAPFVFSRSLEQ